MKRTLLDMVIDILNDMDSDEVNSIDDTIESQQVAQIIKSTYYELMSNRNWPHLKGLVTLDSANDVTKPTYLKLPENVKEMVFVMYDKTKKDAGEHIVEPLKYLHPDQFLRQCPQITANGPDNIIRVQDHSGVWFTIRTNQAPRYWTSFDDEWIVCDSYNKDVDDTLQSTKTTAQVVRMPTWLMEDNFVPDLPAEAFALLTEEAKSTAFFALKQMANDKAEQKSKRQNEWLSRKAWRAKGGVRYQNYGRRRLK